MYLPAVNKYSVRMIVLNVVLILSLATPSVFGGGDWRQQSSLYPLPRIGRAQPGRTWLTASENYEEPQIYIPFPQMGQGIFDQDGGNRYIGDGVADLWFGSSKFSKQGIDAFDVTKPAGRSSDRSD